MKNRAQTSDQILTAYDSDPDLFLSRLITGDETWIDFYDPESKMESMVWTEKGETLSVKALREKSAGKLMLTVFWYAKGPLLLDFLPHKETVTGTYYALLIERLRSCIRLNRRGMLARGPLLLHDNASSHTSDIAQAAIRTAGLQQIPHPAYSPDLAPNDFNLFPALKKQLRGRRFSDYNELKAAVNQWFEERPQQFFQSGIEALRARCFKCILLDGNYLDKI